jgi:drug/metabolite transporter (DMT)-like permease
MTAIVFGLSSALMWGLADFFGGLQSRRAAPLAVTLISQACALALLVIVVVASGGALPSGGEALAALGAGVAAAFGVYCFFAASAGGDLSVAAPLAAAGVAIPVVFGLVTGEQPSALQLTGVVATAGGVVLVSRQAAGRSRADRRALAPAFGAAVGFGLSYVGLDAASGAGFAGVLLVVRTAGVTCLLAATVATRPSLRLTPRRIATIGAIGLLDLAANVAYLVATSEGLIVIASVLVSLYAVVTVILARAFLAERISRSQGGGIVAALGGVGLIAAGG